MVKICKMNGKNIQNASLKLLLEVLEQVFCIVDAEELQVYLLLDSAYPLQIDIEDIRHFRFAETHTHEHANPYLILSHGLASMYEFGIMAEGGVEQTCHSVPFVGSDSVVDRRAQTPEQLVCVAVVECRQRVRFSVLLHLLLHYLQRGS